ncbi:hypothetical protein FHS57_000689 [Runella defluvii]|uniref:Uncharacterized protein n=1 Tax=Runella defluvii TaxID=370973 RepID=A0A7W5ZG29_9BACT|nr:hypothetical protein [Runella defluvii]MBB3836707.1 hypothetical protein [Runella defluvii]
MDFDNYGHLVPYDIIDTDLAAFERIFVTDFTHSSTRSGIFEAYLNYLSDLKQIIGGGFYQWIDGSFTTLKRNPNDIDLVTFIEAQTLQKHASEIGKLHSTNLYRGRKIDAYTVVTYEPTHQHYDIFRMDYLDWLYQFSRNTRIKENPKKGVIQIKF